MPKFTDDRFREMRGEVEKLWGDTHCMYFLTGRCTKPGCKLLHKEPKSFNAKIKVPFAQG